MASAHEKPTARVRPRGRREQKKREKRARIVEAAAELFREQGFHATTGRQICERAGIATGTLFLYVRDKRELLFLIFRPLAEGAFARQSPGLGEDEGVVDGLMRLYGSLLRIYARDTALARLFVQELLFRPDPGQGMRTLNQEFGRRVARVVSEARERRQLRRDVDLGELGQALGAHYVFWIQMWLGTGAVGRRAAERGLRRALELQLEGVGSPRGRTRRGA